MHKIVAGVDGSRASLWALRWALHEASLREIPLHVARIFRPAGWGDEENGRTHATAGPELARLLAYVRSGCPQWTPPEVVPVSIQGEPIAVLAELVDEYDLLVVGAHGKNAAERIALGSVSTWAVRKAPCPVTVIPGPRQIGEADPAAVLDRWDSDTAGPGLGVVVGVDGSERSAQALGWAIGHAGVHGLPLSVVHAWRSAEGTAGADSLAARAWRREDADLARQVAQEMVDKALADRTEPVPVPVGVSTVEGDPATVLTNLSHGAHGLVVGRRGHNVHWRVIGGVTSHVVHHAACPVTVVP